MLELAYEIKNSYEQIKDKKINLLINDDAKQDTYIPIVDKINTTYDFENNLTLKDIIQEMVLAI